MLEAVGICPSVGICPRSISLSPDGKYLAAANQESGGVVVFSRDKESGELDGTAGRLGIAGAACVKWA